MSAASMSQPQPETVDTATHLLALCKEANLPARSTDVSIAQVLFCCLQGTDAFVRQPYHQLRHPMIFYYGGWPAAAVSNSSRSCKPQRSWCVWNMRRTCSQDVLWGSFNCHSVSGMLTPLTLYLMYLQCLQATLLSCTSTSSVWQACWRTGLTSTLSRYRHQLDNATFSFSPCGCTTTCKQRGAWDILATIPLVPPPSADHMASEQQLLSHVDQLAMPVHVAGSIAPAA